MAKIERRQARIRRIRERTNGKQGCGLPKTPSSMEEHYHIGINTDRKTVSIPQFLLAHASDPVIKVRDIFDLRRLLMITIYIRDFDKNSRLFYFRDWLMLFRIPVIDGTGLSTQHSACPQDLRLVFTFLSRTSASIRTGFFSVTSLRTTFATLMTL